MSVNSKAQVSADENFAYRNQKIHVNISISPSTKEFKAGLTTVDSSATRIRLWVTNREERKCTITIASAAGMFWNISFKDAYYNQVYDVSQLDDGEYTIDISDGKTSFKKILLINSVTYFKRTIDLK